LLYNKIYCDAMRSSRKPIPSNSRIGIHKPSLTSLSFQGYFRASCTSLSIEPNCLNYTKTQPNTTTRKTSYLSLYIINSSVHSTQNRILLYVSLLWLYIRTTTFPLSCSVTNTREVLSEPTSRTREYAHTTCTSHPPLFGHCCSLSFVTRIDLLQL